MVSLTAHCLVKNEENFVAYAIRSVIEFVDRMIIFDTGSTDGTWDILQSLQREYPSKISLEEKGECDKKRHTELREEMLQRTETDWFMVLDGDEVWTKRGMEEVVSMINSNSANTLIAPFYLCVGDVYHYSARGKFEIQGKKIHATYRVFKKRPGLHWSGEYESDVISSVNGDNVVFLKNRFWHLTHLQRSSIDDVYSSGGTRKSKQIATYFLVGRKIGEQIPEVFGGDAKKLSSFDSVKNFVPFVVGRLKKKIL